MIDCVAAPVDQVFPVADEEVKVTEPPAQKVVGPLAVIVGVGGSGFTVTVTGKDITPHNPVETLTVNVPPAVTVMDCVVAPVDHEFPVVAEEVNTTEPPEQKVVGPPAVIVGTGGVGLTVTVVAADVEEQVPLETVTVYEPEAVTVIDCAVAPVDQVFPVAEDDVKVTELPEQNVVGPPAVMVGTGGSVFTVTNVAAEVDEQDPLETVTVYEPLVVTVIDCVVAPVDQLFPVDAEDVNVTEPPAQKEVGPPAVIVGVAGVGLTVTVVAAEVAEQPFPSINVTV